MKVIYLGQGAFTVMDDDTYEQVKHIRWQLSPYGYAHNHHHGLLHHYALAKTGNQKVVVDHINMDKLDNRKCNLRYLNKSHNFLNRAPTIANCQKGWKLTIHCGYYPTEEEAIKVQSQIATIMSQLLNEGQEVPPRVILTHEQKVEAVLAREEDAMTNKRGRPRKCKVEGSPVVGVRVRNDLGEEFNTLEEAARKYGGRGDKLRKAMDAGRPYRDRIWVRI